MKLHQRLSRPPRHGFTLIELLVVVGIVIVLMSLLLPAVMKIYGKVGEFRVKTEMRAMEQSLEAGFKQRYGRFPPSRIVLIENGTYDVINNPMHAASAEYLRLIFNGIYLHTNATTDPAAQPHQHDWDGDGMSSPSAIYALEGDECLVYFLRGPNGQGFCTDKARPTTGQNRYPPLFEFDTTRLAPSSRNPGFFVYNDRYGTPYAYFLARDVTTNNYFNDCPSLITTANSKPTMMPPYDPTMAPFVPYYSAPPPPVTSARKFHRPDRFQLISAGKDTLFGQGGFYDPANAGALQHPADKDNLTNFSGGQLQFGN